MFGAIYLMLSGVGVIGKFALLGTLQNRNVLIVDAGAVAMKFVVGVLLVSTGYGATAIILALISQVLITAICLTALSVKKFGFLLNSFSYLKTIIKAGASNSPAKISRVTIMSLSVILLSFFGIQAEEIGFFYIALMISIFSSGIATSIATMAIPASSISNLDLSAGSTRIGLGLTIPIITGVITSPIFILNIVNPSFLEASDELVVLGFAAIPSILIANAITKLNNLNQLRQLILLGIIEVAVFITVFLLLVPSFGIMGSAIAVLAGFFVTGSISVFWLGRNILRSVSLSVLSLAIGIAAGFALNQILGQGVVVFVVAIAVSLVTVIFLKLITVGEFRAILSSVLQRPD
jgi:O-antigen/teichoic acid export membrane protein